MTPQDVDKGTLRLLIFYFLFSFVIGSIVIWTEKREEQKILTEIKLSKEVLDLLNKGVKND